MNPSHARSNEEEAPIKWEMFILECEVKTSARKTRGLWQFGDGLPIKNRNIEIQDGLIILELAV